MSKISSKVEDDEESYASDGYHSKELKQHKSNLHANKTNRIDCALFSSSDTIRTHKLEFIQNQFLILDSTNTKCIEKKPMFTIERLMQKNNCDVVWFFHNIVSSKTNEFVHQYTNVSEYIVIEKYPNENYLDASMIWLAKGKWLEQFHNVFVNGKCMNNDNKDSKIMFTKFEYSLNTLIELIGETANIRIVQWAESADDRLCKFFSFVSFCCYIMCSLGVLLIIWIVFHRIDPSDFSNEIIMYWYCLVHDCKILQYIYINQILKLCILQSWKLSLEITLGAKQYYDKARVVKIRYQSLRRYTDVRYVLVIKSCVRFESKCF